MTEVELSRKVKERLIHHYLNAVGEHPTDGSFRPSDETLTKLYQIYTGRGWIELDEFLRDSIRAFLHRTRTTKTPFFVNSHLLSKSALEYVGVYKQSSQYFSELSWEEAVKQELNRAEQDFLRVILVNSIGKGKVTWAASFLPPPWWVVAGELMQRFTRKEIPEYWVSDRPVKVGAATVRFNAQYQEIRNAIKKSSQKQVILESLFIPILETQAMHFLETLGLIGCVRDAFRKTVLTSTKLFDGDFDETKRLCEVDGPLASRDANMLSELESHLSPVSGKRCSSKKTLPKVPDLSDDVRRMLATTEDA